MRMPSNARTIAHRPWWIRTRFEPIWAFVTFFVLILCAPTDGFAQSDYPSQSIKVIIPFPAGGLPDTTARIVTAKMQVLLGKPMVIENRPGASGGIAASALLTAPVDGHTILLTEGSILYNSLVVPKLSYDWRELTPVVQLARAAQFLAIHPKVPADSMEEFVTYARSAPNKINYGSAGIGSPHHLAMEAVKSAFKLDLLHVPYKGANEAVPALIGGHIDIMWIAYPSIAGAVRQKQLRLLANNSPQVSPLAPDVPPMAKFIPGFDASSLVGIFVKAGTPEPIMDRISGAALAASADVEVKDRLLAAGVEAAGVPRSEYTAALTRERSRIQKIVVDANIRQE
jgi:tripartite-type tricarboxylate transporter receptor subunit TctC